MSLPSVFPHLFFVSSSLELCNVCAAEQTISSDFTGARQNGMTPPPITVDRLTIQPYWHKSGTAGAAQEVRLGGDHGSEVPLQGPAFLPHS